MTKPVTPSQAEECARVVIPAVIIEIVNQLIVNDLKRGRAVVLQSVIENAYRRITNKSIDVRWLDFEDLYRQSGWDVKYEAPAHYEYYEARFIFTAKKDY